MKIAAWERDGKWHAVTLFANDKSVAVSIVAYDDKLDAIDQGKRVRNFCGLGYKDNNFPWRTTNPKTGKVTVHYNSETITTF